LAAKSDHEFVPVHELLSEKEANAVLEKLGLKRENLPKIFTEDAQSKKLGAKPGQIIRIYRKDNGHEYEYYRFVVEA
jgi:DNA-directed RNA polymerase subunit H